MKTNTIIKILLLAAVGLMLTGCSQTKPLANDPGTYADDAPGCLTVSLTDSPGNYSALTVEILLVEAYHDNRGWVVLNDSPQLVDVMELVDGAEAKLAKNTQMGNGSYSKIRLTFGDENYVRFKPGMQLAGIIVNENGEARLSLGELSQIEIDINHDLNAQVGAKVLLDFNVAQSITQRANQCVLNPVITEIEDILTGVQGSVENHPGAAVILSDGVYSYGTYVNNQGEFLLRGVDGGTYDLIVIPAGETPEQADEHRIEGIVVIDGKITQMGNIHL